MATRRGPAHDAVEVLANDKVRLIGRDHRAGRGGHPCHKRNPVPAPSPLSDLTAAASPPCSTP
ncbi:protein of unknown function [Rhodovastum atsumiense]|nr:protein of unknown function [Rhodovastum atsumiense]